MTGTDSNDAADGPGMLRSAGLLWVRFIWRHWLREWKLTTLLVGVLALGVAVFLGVRLGNKAALTGFGFFTESIAGESDFIIRSETGTIPVAALGKLRQAAGALPVSFFAVKERSATFELKDGEKISLRLVGADWVALQNYGSGGGGILGSGDNDPRLGESGAVIIGESFEQTHGISEGDRFKVYCDDREVELNVVGIIPDDPLRPEVPANLVLIDLPGLWALVESEPSLSRIECQLPSGSLRDELKRAAELKLRESAEALNLVMETPQDRKTSVTEMSRAFRLNLTILSGLALLVGIYLILQALEATVVKRRSEIATLRSLGVTPRQIQQAWLLESLVLGIVGSLVGILLGRLLAVGLVGAISQTVNTLYYETTTASVSLSVGEIAFALFYGILSSLIAGWIPAREAALTPPAQGLRSATRVGGLAFLGKYPIALLMLGLGIAAAWIPPLVGQSGSRFAVGGYASAILLVVGASLLIGVLFPAVARLLRAFGGKRVVISYAASQLARPSGRHRLTAAGLSVAIGMSAAMGILVASFEYTLTSWIGQLLRADAYVASGGNPSISNDGIIREQTWQAIASSPEVEGVDILRSYLVEVDGVRVFVGGTDLNSDSARYLELVWEETPDEIGPDALERLSGDLVAAFVNEPFFRRFGLGKSDTFTIPTPQGDETVSIEGVYADYGTETGTILLSRKHTSAWFGDNDVSNLSIYLKDPDSVDEWVSKLGQNFPALSVQSNRRLREESIRIFHQTFAVTYALEAIAVIIAMAGLGMALAGLLIERRRQLATLKAIGTTRAQIATMAMWEGVGLTLVGLIGGYFVSLALGWVLIDVINPQSFGWTLQYYWPLRLFIFLGIAALAIGGIVSWVVGYRFANLRSDRTE
ncbi:MAG: FtsX-like permease family protein [Verrucomicrobiota bacterium]